MDDSYRKLPLISLHTRRYTTTNCSTLLKKRSCLKNSGRRWQGKKWVLKNVMFENVVQQHFIEFHQVVIFKWHTHAHFLFIWIPTHTQGGGGGCFSCCGGWSTGMIEIRALIFHRHLLLFPHSSLLCTTPFCLLLFFWANKKQHAMAHLFYSTHT